MQGVRARVVVFASAALVAAGSALGGCGGSLVIGTPGTGGAATTGTGGAATTGTGGAATTGTGGTTGDAGSDFGQPACPSTSTSTIYNGGTCTPTDIQLCYKTCGVENIGVRSETCRNGTYSQMSGCLYDPSRDYSCYEIPTSANTACPAGVTPQASMPCNVPYCTACNTMLGIAGGVFLDSTGAAKTGFCVCRPPDASGTRTWSCASDTSWPCPAGVGCGGTTVPPFVSEPACLPTVVGGGACTAATDQGFCYKPCGPQNAGVRLEACMGVYFEQACKFDPNKNSSCYKIPTAPNVACPAGVTPQSSMVCDVPACTPCNSLGGGAGGFYLDALGELTTVGWCVCQPPDASGTRTWSCASDMEWPCPRGQGC